MTFNKSNLTNWFNKQGGKHKSPMEKPYLTPNQKKERKTWCEKIKDLISSSGDKFYACFLEEKWFYTTSRRRKIKSLPPGQGEDPDEVAMVQPATRSRHHAIKVMFLGVVAPPIPEEGFNGKIFLDRVTREEGYKK